MILQACSDCHRQYDVTHLELGSRVRCVCEALLTVERPKEIHVRAWKCSNCGGRIEVGQYSCGYCESKLKEKDLTSTLCPACFHRIEDDAKHCKACGVEIAPQGLTALPEGEDACPRCQGYLVIRSLGEETVVECPDCQGLWVKRADFEAICQRAQERPRLALESGGPPESVRAAEPERKVFYIPCPICRVQMHRKMFRYKDLPSRVVIDYCREHGVWFDGGELEAIVAFVRSKADVERPFSLDDSTQRRLPSMIPIEQSRGTMWEGAAGWVIADALGEVLGGVLGGLFD